MAARGLPGDLILVLLGILAAMALRSGVGIFLRLAGASAGASILAVSSSKSGADFIGAVGDGLASRPLTASRRALIALRMSRSTGVRPAGVRPVEARLDARAEPGVPAFSCAWGEAGGSQLTGKSARACWGWVYVLMLTHGLGSGDTGRLGEARAPSPA